MATSPIYSWPEPDNTDLVKNGALAIRTLGNAIDTTMGTMVAKTVVDAKGDLIAGTAADTVNRLAVGNNGETLVADSAATTGLRYQSAYNGNAIINGGMDIWQRGTSIAGSTTAFLADRFRAYRNTTGSTFSRQTSSLTGIQYCYRLQRDSGTTATNGVSTIYTAESADAYRFASQTVTLSFYARAGANFSSASSAINVNMQTGTGTDQAYGSFTGAVNAVSTTQVITTSWVRYSFNATFGSSVSQFALDIGFTPVGTAGAADYFEITGVQLEVGSVATSFKRSGSGGGTLQGELSACQRYYWRFTVPTAYANLAPSAGIAASTTVARFAFLPPVPMRTTPSSLDYSTIVLYDSVATSAVTSAAHSAYTTSSVMGVDFTVASGLVQYRPYQLLSNNSTSAYLGASAEL
jgi:hypothetical protein